VDCNYSKRGFNDWICNPNNNKTVITFIKDVGEYKTYELRNKGECGTNGKNPGKGGSGGLSGFSGVFIQKIKSISHLNHDNSINRLGIHGNHGKGGIGGYAGNSYLRTYHIYEPPVIWTVGTLGYAAILYRNGFMFDSVTYYIPDTKPWGWDRIIPTQERCQSTHDGYNPKEKNSKSQIQPQNSQTDLSSHETEYLKFISNLELKESKLQERDFNKLLLKGNNTL
jgi:hypothetical protein